MTLWAASRYELARGSSVAAVVVSTWDPSAFFALTASATFFYLVHYLYPFNLVAFYPPWSENTLSPIHLFQIAVLSAGSLLLALGHFKWRRTVTLGLGFYVLNLLPIIVLIFARYPYFVWSLDHSAYVPILGLIGLTVAALEQLHQRLPDRLRPLMIVTLILIALPISINSRTYASNFVDAKTLWIYTLQHGSTSDLNRIDGPQSR